MHVDEAPNAYERIEAFLKQYPSAAWGPAHIVLDDQNLGKYHIKWCIALTKAALTGDKNYLLEDDDIGLLDALNWYQHHSPEELRATIKFLKEVLAIPEEER